MIKPALAAAALAATAQGATPVDPCAGDDGRSVAKDFGQFCVYHADNARIAAEHRRIRVVFMGDSITEGWKLADPALFPADIANRGISGQTTGQMLLRFRADVIALKPATVHIMAGTNDVAGNPGAAPLDRAVGNIRSMVELARAHRIRVVLGAIPPAKVIGWRPGVRPAAVIAEFNRRLKAYAAAERIPYIDYHAALADAEGGMRAGASNDGVHPTKAGYAVMTPLAMKALGRRDR